MRFEKFTTKLQEAFAEAQSLAVGQDHQQIEPQHLLAALLAQEDGAAASLIAKAGGNSAALKQALQKSIARLPKVEGTPGEVHVSRDLANLLNVADKEAQKRGDQQNQGGEQQFDAAGQERCSSTFFREDGGGLAAVAF